MINNIAICDDSIEYGEIVTEIINNISLKNNINCNISTFSSGKSLVQAFKKNKFDIIFLDMEMPDLNGIETGLLVREISKDPVIFYLTSHKEYAYESYQVKAKNYFLKPVDASVIEKNLLECFEEKKKDDRFLDIKDVEGTMHRIPVKEITHILRKKEDRKLHIYTLDKREVIVVQTLESIETELSYYESIARASKSCVVNMENVKSIVKNEIYFSNDAKDYASRRCLPGLLKRLS